MKMTNFFLLGVLLLPIINAQNKVVCNYKSSSHNVKDIGKFVAADIEHALTHCTHILYDHAIVDDSDFTLKSSNPGLDLANGLENYKAVTMLKKRYPGLHILLSVGSWDDIEGDVSKYLTLLKESFHRTRFINSAFGLIKEYGFDGIDLAWRFPLVRIKKRSRWSSIWNRIKTTFTQDKYVDIEADLHRAGFSALIREMKAKFQSEGYLVTASVLPHTNYTLYWDLPRISPDLNAIHIQSFDYITPEPKISPNIADYPAALFSSPGNSTIDEVDHSRLSVDAQINWFLKNGAPANKIILGIPAHGIAWKLNGDNIAGTPPVEADGAGAEGYYSARRGILFHSELCNIIKGKTITLVPDPTKHFGAYAWRPESAKKEGIWIGYDDESIAAEKGAYAKRNGLGGIALYDLSSDDFKGTCNGTRFPLLKSAAAANR